MENRRTLLISGVTDMGSFDELKNWELKIQDIHGKYQLGKGSDAFEDIKDLKPVFSFDYASFEHDGFAFDSKTLGANDYKKLIKGLKDISTHTYSVINQEYRFHFHEWEDVTVPESDFYKCIYGGNTKKRDVKPYQFKVFEEARNYPFEKLNLDIEVYKLNYSLNDDIEIIEENWLDIMVGQAMLPHTGAVGAKLWYPQEERIQHAGITNM